MLVSEVEAGDWLVEQQERPASGVSVALRQDPGELHPLAFAAGQHGEGPVGEGERFGLREGVVGKRADLPVG